ncbi:CpsD/CapB family tyrosine-protein kinase [Niallia endozanthoxylica]|uniref:non-specific protein-tyrosine kinase n=1 Tax=Niallia endozanthoxylica TaxID=2036016 RepID=A0A5J5H2Q9_9BACI|nr:CpsD/CapB family tyrosine-protein kinase [Niallia endozanthoxylica]KAA9014193.1 CpsD/CapB family tyrosine-protein kinase [Niallia endozanthoxylica]
MKFKKKEKNKLPNKKSLVTFLNSRSPISEQYRTIRTNIQFSSDLGIRSIVVTSSAPGEGKSTTVANLAIVFAQQGKKTLLIDADMRKPTVHYKFNVENQKGLTHVLTKRGSLEGCIQESAIENLSILTTGPIPPNPAELLGSQVMKDLLDKALEQYDMILIDTPPVLAVTDAQILANLCDGTILVIKSGETEVEAAIKAKELLLSANGKLLGTVLNHKNVNQSHYYYYYGSE